MPTNKMARKQHTKAQAPSTSTLALQMRMRSSESEEAYMHIANSEELIQMEVEHIAENLYGTSYFDLPPKMKLYVRLRAMDLLWPADFQNGFIAAA